MRKTIEVSPMRWRDTHKVFENERPMLIFLVDRLDEAWNAIPEDVVAVLETLQSTSPVDVHVYEVDFRVEADFLSLFGTRPGPCVVRRLPHDATFESLSVEGDFSWTKLVEFCRVAYAWQARFIATGGGRRSKNGASGEITMGPR